MKKYEKCEKNMVNMKKIWKKYEKNMKKYGKVWKNIKKNFFKGKVKKPEAFSQVPRFLIIGWFF